MRTHKEVISCFISLLTSAAIAQVTNVFTPVADTYVRNQPGYENMNYGNLGYIYLYSISGRDYFGYVRFDLSSLAPGTQLMDASLTLTKVTTTERNDTLTSGRFRALGLKDVAGNTPQNWDELTLTWNTKGTEYVSENTYDPSRVVDFDGTAGNEVVTTTTATISGTNLVSFLNERIAAGGLATFIFDYSVIETSGRGYGLGSKENTDPATWPQLTVVIPEPGTIGFGVAALVLMLIRRTRK